MAENKVCGEGKHSHEVPSEIGRVVLMLDGGHAGTEVYRTEDGFRFVSLDRHEVSEATRCVLVQLTGVSIEDVSEPYACDLDSPDGLALVGCDAGAEVPGEILWDSASSPLCVMQPVARRLTREERDAEIATGIAATLAADATDAQRADYREGWHEGFRAFAGDRAVGRTQEYRAGFEAGYLQGTHVAAEVAR